MRQTAGFFVGLFSALLLAWQVAAQGVLTLGAGSSGKVGPSFLIDTLSVSPIVAYSTRKLRAGYTSSNGALQVITGAGGHAATNIGFTGTGDLDTTALASAIGSNDGAIKIWYDQSGNGTNATPQDNVNFTNGAGIVSGGTNFTLNGHVVPNFTQVNNWGTNAFFIATVMVFGGASPVSQPVTVAMLFQLTNTASNGMMVESGGLRFQASQSSGGNYVMWAGTLQLVGTTDTSTHSGFWIFNGASSNLFIDGSDILGGANPGADALFNGNNAEQIGNNSTRANIAEILIFSTNIGSTDRSTIRSSWQSYWAAP